MLIKKHIFINKVKQKYTAQKPMPFFYAYLKLFHVFPQLIKVWKSKQVPLKSFCHISAAAEKQL